MGFEPLDEDPYILVLDGEQYIIIYVDNILIAAPTEEDIESFVEELSTRFGTKILGEPSRFLGCKLHRDQMKKTITMSQAGYVPEILANSGFYDGKPIKASVPMKISYKTAVSETPAEKDIKLEYQIVTGKANWLALKTRPDISYK
jgi:Reverse transcriptase (RNA-dependent DNA polymerase).